MSTNTAIYKRGKSLGLVMHKKSVVVFVFILVVQALSAGLSVVPQETTGDSWQGPVLETGARSVGVLTDSQQQSMLYNQSYNGNNDNDGDGVTDNLDSDDDNDCIPDSNDTSPYDFDGDGINDESDLDDDGDGLNDSLEVSDSNASTNIYDADNDGNHDCAFFPTGNNSSGNNSGGNNSGGNNSGGNNSGPSTGCGYDVNYTSVYTYSPYMVMENQSFTTTIYVNCEVYNSSMFLDYWIYDSSNYTVYSGNQSWTSMNNYSNFNWSVPGLTTENYTFHAQLYVGGSYHDSSSSGIVVYMNSSGGGGNNSGNQTSPCGNNINYVSVYAYAPYMMLENQSFLTSMYVNCEIYNANMELVYWIYDTNNYTVYSGNQSWTGTNNNSNFNWSVGGLSVGNYTFHADLYVNGTYVDSDSDGIMVYANNSGGGGNTGGNNTGGNNTNEYVDIDHSGYAYETSNMVEVWDSGTDVHVEFTSGNLVVGENYQLIWNLSDSTYNVDVYGSGNVYWNASSTTSQENSTISGLADGVYYFHATLVNQGSHIASDTTMIQMGNNTGGNNTGGNNTGGNNTGGNNTGGNNTGGNNTGGNNTGGNNTCLLYTSPSPRD